MGGRHSRAFYSQHDPRVLGRNDMAVAPTHLAGVGSTAAVPGFPHVAKRTLRLALARSDARLATTRARTRRLVALRSGAGGCGSRRSDYRGSRADHGSW